MMNIYRNDYFLINKWDEYHLLRIPCASACYQTVASFTKEVSLRLAKRQLVFNGRLANHELTSLVKEANVLGPFH